jgi:hypothetical protein
VIKSSATAENLSFKGLGRERHLTWGKRKEVLDKLEKL